MGITCIKTEPSMKSSVSFTYQNMIKYITTTPIEKDYDFIGLLGKGSFS